MMRAGVSGARVITPDAVMNAVDSVMMRPWDWGRGHHCLGDVADVLVSLGGPDIMAGLRWTYRSQRGALRIIAEAGGVPALLAREAAAAGLVWGAAVPGAVGTAPGLDDPAVVICLQPGQWVGKTQAGYAVVSIVMEGWAWRF